MTDHSQTARLAVVVPAFPKLSETFIVSKVQGLLGRGWDVHVVCGSSDTAEWKRFPQLQQRADIRQRVHVGWPHRPCWLAGTLIPFALGRCFLHNLNGTHSYLKQGWSRFGLDVLRRLYLDADLVALKPDLIHFEFGALAVGRMYLKELLGCKVTVSFRGYDLNYVGLETPDYYQEVWEKADALHLLGEDLWRRAQRRGCPPDKEHVLIAPAIDTQLFESGKREYPDVVGTPNRPLRILSVGRLEWKKGYEYGLQAIQLLVKQGLACEYRLVGDGKYLESLAFARHRLGLETSTYFLGAQPRPEVKSQLLWADIFLHPAVSEGFCNAVMEAQAMKLPVVCTDADGLSENVANGETGFVVWRRNPQALADKLALLARDSALRQRIGEAGRARVQRCFRLQEQITAFDQFSKQVINTDAN